MKIFNSNKLIKSRKIISLKLFSTDNTNTNINFVKVEDIKSFGKKFNDDEMKKYLDPFGFLASNECTNFI